VEDYGVIVDVAASSPDASFGERAASEHGKALTYGCDVVRADEGASSADRCMASSMDMDGGGTPEGLDQSAVRFRKLAPTRRRKSCELSSTYRIELSSRQS
jgi:hypothetical protein